MSDLTYRKLVDLLERELFEPGAADERVVRSQWFPLPPRDSKHMQWGSQEHCDLIRRDIANSLVPIPSFLRAKPSYRYIGRVENYDVWERKSFGRISHEQYQRFPLMSWAKVQA